MLSSIGKIMARKTLRLSRNGWTSQRMNGFKMCRPESPTTSRLSRRNRALKPTAPEPAEPPSKPFATLPNVLGLPEASEKNAVAIGELLDGVSISSIELLAGAAKLPTDQSLALRAVTAGKSWEIIVIDKGQAPVALATLRHEGRSLLFQWEENAGIEATCLQVSYCVLKLSDNENTHVMALREPAINPALILDLDDRDTNHDVLIGPLPNPNTLWLEVGRLDALPLQASFKFNRSRIQNKKTDALPVIVAFEKINISESPEVEVRFLITPEGSLSLRVSRVLRLPAGEQGLTTAYIIKRRVGAERRLADQNRELAKIDAQIATNRVRLNQARVLRRQIHVNARKSKSRSGDS